MGKREGKGGRGKGNGKGGRGRGRGSWELRKVH